MRNKTYDIRDIDWVAFDEVILLKNLLEQLVCGIVFPDDLIRESENLKSYFMSLGLCIGVVNVENNNMHVSNL